MNHGESHIITGLKKGDERSFNHIFNLYQKPLNYFARQLLGDAEQAKDVVAESFLKVWARKENFESLTSIKAFLYIATRNLCFDYLKQQKRMDASKKDYAYWTANETEVDQLQYTAEIARQLYEEIEALSPKLKQIFKMAYFENRSSEEIARQLNLSIKTVYNQKVTAAQLLRSRLLKNKLTSVLVAGSFLLFDLLSLKYTGKK